MKPTIQIHINPLCPIDQSLVWFNLTNLVKVARR